MKTSNESVFFTGTTYENAVQIFKDGCISARPPHRVWEEHSENFVYLIDPTKVRDELEYETGYQERGIVMAADQASFAVWKLDHSRRVVFDVALVPSACQVDMDAGCSVKYPGDIATTLIRGVYVEKEDNSLFLRESVALRKLIDEDGEETFLQSEDKRFKGLELVKPEFYSRVEARYEELVDWQGNLALFEYVSLESFVEGLNKERLTATCPQCQHPCDPEEMERYQMCFECELDAFERGERDPEFESEEGCVVQ